jgi:hypothetical protein
MASGPERFPFVQLELAGSAGLAEGRYLAQDPERVLVVGIRDAPPSPRRRLRRPRPQEADPEAGPRPVPLTTLTVVRPEPLGDRVEAERWLTAAREDGEAIDTEVESALAVVNRAVHAHRAAAFDPWLADVSADHALTMRLGYGTGEGLADGRWEEAVTLPPPDRAGRGVGLRPQERVAAVLGHREAVAPHEALLLRSRADLDAGREREAALQLRVGLEALLAEGGMRGAQAEGVAELEQRRRITGEAANEALRGDLTPERAAEVAETLRLCERVLRRRQVG